MYKLSLNVAKNFRLVTGSGKIVVEFSRMLRKAAALTDFRRWKSAVIIVYSHTELIIVNYVLLINNVVIKKKYAVQYAGDRDFLHKSNASPFIVRHVDRRWEKEKT